MRHTSAGRAVIILAAVVATAVARQAAATPGPAVLAPPPIAPLCATRIEGEVVLDGRLDEPLWKKACRVERWFETQPGDNTAPPVANVAYLAYNDRYLYVGFELADPDPSKIRAPLGDRDSLTAYMDHVGIVLDARGDGKTAMIFAASARAVQYDSALDDSQDTDDPSPDYYWEAASAIGGDGWAVEMRIPFSTLRYTDRNPTSWRIALYRIYPREVVRHFQSTTLPRGVTCWVCRANPLGGLNNLPLPSGFIGVPYLNSRRVVERAEGDASARPEGSRLTAEVGGDIKWRPSPGHAIDVTLNPDFSQVEADAMQIGANERFALQYPEKRPFFLEGSDLFATPLPVLYSRTITAPAWGARATGRAGATSYTALFARDQGGGEVVIPGQLSSTTASQDFGSWAMAGRVKRDVGSSFVGLVASGREIEGGGYNRVVGPDVEWRPNLEERIVGQLLVSQTQTPIRPDLYSGWDGRSLAGAAGTLRWFHTARRLNWTASMRAISADFRADNGYMPQVGSLRTYGEIGWTFRPEGAVNRLRPYVISDRFADWSGRLLSRETSVGVIAVARWNIDATSRLVFGEFRTGPVVLSQKQLVFDVISSPSPTLSQIEVAGTVGDSIDFDNHRAGTGSDLRLSATLRPSIHVQVQLTANRRVLFVPTSVGEARLFNARVGLLRATYSFSRRTFIRVIGQVADTRREPSLYLAAVDRHTGTRDVSALFAYKLNWQTVFFVGLGDSRILDLDEQLVPSRRDLFVKVSYAFQR